LFTDREIEAMSATELRRHMKKLVRLVPHAKTLELMAKEAEARGLVRQARVRLIIASGAVAGALLSVFAMGEAAWKNMVKVFARLL
jgi:hypothetical protein